MSAIENLANLFRPQDDYVIPEVLKHFISRQQLAVVKDGLKGEEAEFFISKMNELADIIESMPKSGETDGQFDNAIVYLHYFACGSANWYITEKDISNHQHQAFGVADLYGNGGEYGSISIKEIIENNGELDFFWTPKPLGEAREG